MAQLSIRAFARLCLAAARGEDAAALAGGLSPDITLDQLVRRAAEHRVEALLAPVLWHLADSRAIAAGERPAGLKPPIHHVTRALHLKAQLTELDRALIGTGKEVPVLLLKGSVQLFDSAYPAPGLRQMADIDLLTTQAEALTKVLRGLGYQPSERDAAPGPLPPGEYHLPPMLRARDLVAIEVHLHPASPLFRSLLPADFDTNTLPVTGCARLRRPDPVNHLIVMLIHTLRHDRDTLDGGLLLRGLVECELLFTALTGREKDRAKAHFQTSAAGALWAGWRDLAGWAFADARPVTVTGRLLVAEFRLRARGYRMVFAIAVLNRVLRIAQPGYWRSGAARRHGARLGRAAFWRRLYSKFRDALTG